MSQKRAAAPPGPLIPGDADPRVEEPGRAGHCRPAADGSCQHWKMPREKLGLSIFAIRDTLLSNGQGSTAITSCWLPREGFL